MIELFKIGFLSFTLIDLIDIVVVGFVLYRVFLLVKGTRAVQMLFGLLVIVIVTIISQWLNMKGLSWLVSNLRTVWVIAFVVLFQPELRRLLMLIGQSRFVRFIWKEESRKTIDVVVEACLELAKRNYGALMVLQREAGLGLVLETGVTLKAELSSQLLLTIFTPRTSLHDGAVIIRGNSIEAAGCTLPLSQDPDSNDLGMRHKAALGVTEETDAVVVVVSEETRAISVAADGQLMKDLDEKDLRAKLQDLLSGKVEKEEPDGDKDLNIATDHTDAGVDIKPNNQIT
jgi:diadenylate cyclase